MGQDPGFLVAETGDLQFLTLGFRDSWRFIGHFAVYAGFMRVFRVLRSVWSAACVNKVLYRV